MGALCIAFIVGNKRIELNPSIENESQPTTEERAHEHRCRILDPLTFIRVDRFVQHPKNVGQAVYSIFVQHLFRQWMDPKTGLSEGL